MHHYEVDLINQGDIAVDFRLVVPPSGQGAGVGRRFVFSPTEGTIERDGHCTIRVEFIPDLMGSSVVFTRFECVFTRFECGFHSFRV